MSKVIGIDLGTTNSCVAVMTGYSLKVTGEGPEDFFWADRAALERCAVPSAFARYRTEAKELLEEADADAL